MPRQVLLVGHCRPDAFALRSALSSLDDVEFAMIDDSAALDAALHNASLLLVNRVLDGRFEHESGIELIRRLSAKGVAPTTMLVSNYPDAHAEAQAAGALPGFGKRELYDERTTALVRTALGDEA